MIFYFLFSIVYSKKTEKQFFIQFKDEKKWYYEDLYQLSNEIIITNRIQNTTNITLYNCIFESIRDLFEGGAIYLNFDSIYDNLIQLERCKFIKCSGLSGGAIYVTSMHRNYADIKYCLFESNECFTNGGAIFIQSSNIEMLKNDFINNKSIFKILSSNNTKGGAIFLYKTKCSLRNCYFRNNSIEYNNSTTIKLIDGIKGGALCTESSIELYECSFNNNSINFAAYDIDLPKIKGGAVYSGLINCYNSTFISNKIYLKCDNVTSHQYHGGGAIFLSPQSRLNNCSFDTNLINITMNVNDFELGFYAAAVYSGSDIDTIHYLFYCKFINNCIISNITGNNKSFFQSYIFAAADSRRSNCTECNFINNKIIAYGDIYHVGAGAISSPIWIKNCVFLNNSVQANTNENYNTCFYGSSIYAFDTTIIECTFDNNSAQNNFITKGGCVFISQTASLTNCIFTNNIIYSFGESVFGGVIMSDSLEYSNSIIECKFVNNKIISNNVNFSANGEIIYIRDQSMTISNCLFETYLNGNSNSLSLIYFNTSRVNYYLTFTNNLVFFYNSINRTIFDGELYPNTKIRCIFNGNCIYPYNQQLFMNQSLTFINSTNSNEIAFDDAFENECTQKTKEFTKSNEFDRTYKFTQTNKFTQSFPFTKSNEFSPTYEFTKTRIFSQSDDLLLTNIFKTKQTQSTIRKDITFSNSISITLVNVKTVTFTIFYTLSNTHLLSYNQEFNTYFYVLTSSDFHFYMPYIIYSFSPSYVKTYYVIQIKPKNILTQEKLIGIVCGTIALFFIILGIIILYIQRKNKFIYSFYENEFSDISDHTNENEMSFKGIITVESKIENDDANWI